MAFRLKDHLKRLLASCRLMRIDCPYTETDLCDCLAEAVRANGFREDLAVRMTVFIDAEGSWASEGRGDLLVAPCTKPRANPDALKGVSACVSTWQRISDNCLPPRIKAGANYLNARYAHLEARRHGFDLPILLGHSGKVAEGGGACLFLVRNDVLATPTLTSSVLESITRATLLRLARDKGIEVAEREIDRTELYLADEIFLCGSAAEITPVISVDGFTVGCGCPGEVSKSLLRRYHEAVTNELPEYGSWLWPVY